MERSDRRVVPESRNRLRAGVREQGRGDGLLEPAPAQPDLVAIARFPPSLPRNCTRRRTTSAAHGRPLLLDYLAEEQSRGERIVAANEHFTAVVPFWAVWPFEVLVIAHRAVTTLPGLTQPERRALAEIYQSVTTRYDNLFEIVLPLLDGLSPGAER